jgi:ABC-type uncharacterized transport system substrate-binding protein
LGVATAGLSMVSTACGLGPFQPSAQVRIGYLTFGPRETRADRVEAFLLGLRDLGWIEGQTIAIEWRFTRDSGGAQLPELARDLVRLAVDAIMVEGGTSAVEACKEATSTIPIVFANAVDPVETGLVTSLSRPGANVTGTAATAPGVAAKRFEVMRDIVPGLARIMALVDPTNFSSTASWDEGQRAAAAVGVDVQRVDLAAAEALDVVFEEAAIGQFQAVTNHASALLLPVREHFAELTIKHQLPASDINRRFAEAGLLLTYGPNVPANSRRAATRS